MNSCTLRPCAEAKAFATTLRCESFGPIRATDMPFGAALDCVSVPCVLVDISALAAIFLILLLARCRCACRPLRPSAGLRSTSPAMGQRATPRSAGETGSGKEAITACEPILGFRRTGTFGFSLLRPNTETDTAPWRKLNSGPVTDMVTGPCPGWNYRVIAGTCLKSHKGREIPQNWSLCT